MSALEFIAKARYPKGEVIEEKSEEIKSV